jgi:tRNA 2-thiouridine synthesizing protein A
MKADRTLDLRGLNCPLHVLRCKAGLIKTQPGELLRVRMTELSCRHNIPLLVASLGDKLEHMSNDGHVTEFWIRRYNDREGCSSRGNEGQDFGLRVAALVP